MSPRFSTFIFFFFNDTATTEIYTLSLHDALPIFDETDRPPRLDDATLGPEPGLPDRLEKVDLQLQGRERLGLAQGTGVRDPHGGVGHVAEHPAVHRAHGVGVALARLELNHGPAGLDGGDGEAYELRDR